MAKPWTPAEVRQLTELAESKGYNKKNLAVAIGIDPATLSNWMSEVRAGERSGLQRNALSWVEYRLQQLDDRKDLV